jgi:hypothetical protein
MPVTVNQCPPIHTWAGWATLVMPSRLAAWAPRTTAGYRAVAALRKAPCATVMPRVAGRAGSAAVSAMPLVSMAGMNGLRYT